MSNLTKGLFIVFEGADGCGKSTQVDLLCKYLEDLKYETIKTLEPGGCEIGINLRKILLNYEGYVSNRAELFMYLADRAQHAETVISDSINKGKIVICDRYTDSTLAYQGYARGGNIDEITYLNNLATNNLKPDLVLVLDVDIDVAQKRMGKRSEKDRMEKESLDFHTKVKEAYLDIANKNPDKYKVVDANMGVDAVFCEVKKAVDSLL